MVRHPGAACDGDRDDGTGCIPGRVHPRLGLGVPAWIDQMGLTPPMAQLGAMRGVRRIEVRRLLDGEELTEKGKSFEFKSA